MGYSIAVSFKSEEEKNKMKEFLENNIDKNVFSYLNSYNPIVPYEDFAYKSEKYKYQLGFHYGAGTDLLIKDFYFVLCYFMALKSSNSLDEQKFVIYDGHEEWKIKASSEQEGLDVDKTGYKEISQLSLLKKIPGYKILLKSQYKEFSKFDNLVKELIYDINDKYNQNYLKQI